MKFLGALAAGVQSPASSCMDASSARALRLRQAGLALGRWRADEDLQGYYSEWLEGRHMSDPADTVVYDRLYLPTLVAHIKALTGYRTRKRELQKRKLSGVLLIAAHKAFGVREHDLHLRST